MRDDDVNLKLRTSEANLSAAQRLAHLGSWELDLSDLRDLDHNPLHWSDEVFRIFGYEPGGCQVSNETFFEAVHPEDRERIHLAVRLALETGQDYDVEHRIRRPDGELRIVHERSQTEYDATGRPLRLLGTVLDITEQKKAEAAAREADSNWKALVENAQDQILRISPKGEILFVNWVLPAYNRVQLIGSSWLDYFSGGDKERYGELLEETLSKGKASTFEMNYRGPDKQTRWYEVQLGPITQDNLVTGAVLVAREITQKKLNEAHLAAVERMATVGTLAAGLAHEINNPLTAVVANLELALDQLKDIPLGSARDRLERAQEAAERVRKIVRDLKVFSRGQENHTEAVDLKAVVESTLRLADSEFRQRAILVKDFGDVPRVQGNESRLGQVVLNLIINAAHSIAEGHPDTNEICIRTKMGLNGMVALQVCDSGAGMSPEVQRKIFNPLYSTKPEGHGTGLGLTICHRIVAQMGGHIEVQSAPSQGSTFTVLLPAAAEDIALLPVLPRPSITSTPRAKILVVDDEPTLGPLIRDMLLPFHDAQACGGAAEALELLRGGERFDVIVCDLMMPMMSGAALYQELLDLNPAQAAAMIFMSGGTFTDSSNDFLADPNRRCLEKPFGRDELLARVAEVYKAGGWRK